MRKFIKSGVAKKIILSKDCEPKLFNEIIQICRCNDIEIEYIKTMNALGKMCKIDVECAVATIVD